MGSTDKGMMELGPALGALAAGAAPREPDLCGILAESARRKASARTRVRVAGLAAVAALALPLAFFGFRAAFPAPILASATYSGLASELWSDGEARLGLEAELDSYIVALWDASY